MRKHIENYDYFLDHEQEMEYINRIVGQCIFCGHDVRRTDEAYMTDDGEVICEDCIKDFSRNFNRKMEEEE